MPTTTQLRRASTGSRRFGYAVAAIVNAIMFYLINVRPGWAALSFLTADTARVLTLVNLSICAGVVVNLARIAFDPRWFVALGDVISTGIGVLALIRIWQVFPFQFGAGSLDWALVVRVLLIVAIVGSIIGIVAGLMSMLRAIGADRGTSVRDS